ncbi:MAG: hypothetical protein ACOY3Y_03885 [Acidobacteriota bacterium]
MSLPFVAMVTDFAAQLGAAKSSRFVRHPAAEAPAHPAALPARPAPSPARRPLPPAAVKVAKPRGVTLSETLGGEEWLECSACGLVAVRSGRSVTAVGRGQYTLADAAAAERTMRQMRDHHRDTCEKLSLS